MANRMLVFLILLALANSSAAQPTSNPAQFLFILDASGSMWQKLGPDFKISMAKSVMKDLTEKLPGSSRVGLIAYGHQREDDCDDIQVLAPLGPLNKPAFISQIEAINPVGKTPIAKSLQQALDLVKSQTTPVTIILVSDGLETCEGNACNIVASAREQGVKITVHVVGFGIAEKDISALECIAQSGAGQYLPAFNAGELTEALQQTIQPPSPIGGYLSVKVSMEGKLTDANIKVFSLNNPQKAVMVGRTYTGPATNPRVMALPSGEYFAEVTALGLEGQAMQILEKLTIGGEDTLAKTVHFDQGVFEVLVTRNNALSDAVVTLYKAGTAVVAAQTRSYTHSAHNPARLSVPPGLYDVNIRSLEVNNKTTVTIKNQNLTGGGQISLSQNFVSGELKIGAKQGAGLVDATIAIYSKKTGEQIAAGRTYQATSSNPRTFVLEPGGYEVRLTPVKPAGLSPKILSAAVAEKGISIVTGEWK